VLLTDPSTLHMLSNPLLATKFQPPPLRPNRVERSRLLEKLEQGCQFGGRLSLICAPAGYGKTILAVEWLQWRARHSGWRFA
jgi:LuxR family transcriptional regulator, maltose regulon positive regulatory protein